MDVRSEVMFNERIYEIVHIYKTGFMELKEKGRGNLKPIILVSEAEVEWIEDTNN